MYLGGFVFFASLMTNASLAQFLGYFILAVYMIIGAFREDRRLARELGDVYRMYQKEVPLFFPKIPGSRV
jgi:protein-S-isoprenylcysteine O-methyltransferase Ste14